MSKTSIVLSLGVLLLLQIFPSNAELTKDEMGSNFLNLVYDCGASFDGVSDASASFRACLQKSRWIIIPSNSNGGPTVYVLNSTVKVPSDAVIICSAGSNIILKANEPEQPALFDLSDTTNVEIGLCTLDGNKSIMRTQRVSPPIVGGDNVKNSNLHDLKIENPLEGVVLGSNLIGKSSYNSVRSVTVTDSAHHAFVFANGEYNMCIHCGGAHEADFVFWITGTERRDLLIDIWTAENGIELIGTEKDTSQIYMINPHVERPSYPQWAASSYYSVGEKVRHANNVYSASRGAFSGRKAPDCTSDICSDGNIPWRFVKRYISTGDNCISIVGSYSAVIGGKGEGCLRNAIGLYGDHNIVMGFYSSNNAQLANGEHSNSKYYCVEIDSAYGGLARHNTIVANICDDTQAQPTQYSAIGLKSGYPRWKPFVSYVHNFYVSWSYRIYLTTRDGVSGSFPPTCESGSCFDGNVYWNYSGNYGGDAEPSSNTVVLNYFGPSRIKKGCVDFGTFNLIYNKLMCVLNFY